MGMKKHRILVVDDMLFMRDMMVSFIRKSFPHIEVEVSANGADAQSKMEVTPPDLILCDWELPDIKGNELLRWIRSHHSSALSTKPFIMVTARRDKEAILEAKELGVTDYIIKPLTMDVLNSKIKTVLKI